MMPSGFTPSWLEAPHKRFAEVGTVENGHLRVGLVDEDFGKGLRLGLAFREGFRLNDARRLGDADRERRG